jgi:AcrR family transcriptional regulator
MAKTDASKVKLRTIDKRTAGRRAKETRDRIFESLGKLLTTMSYRDIRVTDVVKDVGTSPATFYQYFADIEAAALALAADVTRDATSLKGLAEGATAGGKGASASLDRIIDGIGSFCREHEAVIRVVETAAGEGDARFKKVRATLLASLAAPLAAVAGDSKEGKANAAAATSLVVATTGNRALDAGAPAAEIRGAVGRLVFWGITGRKPS